MWTDKEIDDLIFVSIQKTKEIVGEPEVLTREEFDRRCVDEPEETLIMRTILREVLNIVAPKALVGQ